MAASLRRVSIHFQFWSQICPPTQFSLDVEGGWGWFSQLILGVLAMGTESQQRDKQGRHGEPSLWARERTEDWADEHTEDVQSLLEENARLRGLLVQLSDLIRRNVPDSR
jgi:hypothetical protein